MEKFNKVWRAFYAAGMIAIAVQQLLVKDFRPVIVPPAFPAYLAPARMILMWIVSAGIIAAGLLILIGFAARVAALWLGAVLLLFTVVLQLPFIFASGPAHLYNWINPIKEFALSGGAFVVASSFVLHGSGPVFLEKLMPWGKCFFAIMLIVFGASHFVYPDFTKMLVPTWVPGSSLFWTYFSATALIMSGIAIMINVQRTQAANLLGLMLFLWVVMLHIPRAIADPHSGAGNEWTSVFEALAFSGIAFLIATQTKTSKKL